MTKKTVSLATPETQAAAKAARSTKRTPAKRTTKRTASAVPATKGKTIDLNTLAAECGKTPKTLRAGIRRNADKWQGLSVNADRKPTDPYVFRYDAKSKALLNELTAAPNLSLIHI